VEQEHWWFRARRHIIVSLLDRYAPPPCDGRLRVCDFGCGTGGNLAAIADRYDVTGIDKAPEAVAYAKRRLGDRVVQGELPNNVDLPSEAFDAVLITDVLEHVEDDKGTVETALRILRPDGVIVSTVPAHPWLFCEMDRRLHHFRRYSKRQFRQLFTVDSADVELLSYFNTLLFVPAAVVRYSSKFLTYRDATVDLEVPHRAINAVLEPIMRSEAALIGRAPFPIGFSLAAVVRKQTKSHGHVVHRQSNALSTFAES
jgi:SAM-dependent methyltransferase